MLTVLLALLLPQVAFADPGASSERTVSNAARDEARQRFDSGLVLYNQGDVIGALAEFKRAYQLTGHPAVLFNLALSHAKLGQAAETVLALETLRAKGYPELGSERVARAEQVYREQLAKTATIRVIVTNAERVAIQIDNVDVGKDSEFRVTAGVHLLSLSAPGFLPRHLKLTVARGAREVITVELTPIAEPLAYLKIASSVADVEVRASGQFIGRTPLSGELSLAPGSYELEFTRKGYVPVRRRLQLQAGMRAELEVPMVPSAASLDATLVLELSEQNAVVSIDGRPELANLQGIRLPVGRHSLRIQKAGFFDVVREIELKSGTNTLDVTLLPTATYLDDYVSRAQRQRTWAFIALGAGTLALAGSAGFLIWNHDQKADAERKFKDYVRAVESSPSKQCSDQACSETLGILIDELDARRQRDIYGWLGVGVGGAAVATGALLFVLGNNPRRYDPKPESDVFAKLGLSVSLGKLSVCGSF